jgi:hypothetical protein
MSDKSTIRCATCLWFERGSAGDRTHGLCMYQPPVIQVVVPPPTPVGQPRPSVQGLRPPTGESDRCHHWEKQFHPVRTLLTLAAPDEKAP